MAARSRKTSRKRQASGLRSFLGLFLIYFLLGQTVIMTVTYIAVKKLSVGLPDHEQLKQGIAEQELSTRIYSSDGVLLKTKGGQDIKRLYVHYQDIPQCMIDALIAAEDSRFYQHWGFSLPDFMRAMVANIKALKNIKVERIGRFPYFKPDFDIAQGGSTITQQLARGIFLTPRQTIKRKLQEILVAINIEHNYSKSEILEFYLNRMDFGHNWFGIQVASRGWFGKNAENLTIREAAMLAGILRGTTIYRPDRNPELARKRRDTVLGMMVNTGKITRAQAVEEMSKPIELAEYSDEDGFGRAPFFVDAVVDELYDRYGVEEVTTGGLRVETTLDYRLQRIAEEALEKQLETIQTNYADKLRYRRPPGLEGQAAVKDSLDRTRVQGAFICIEVSTGRILAMIGGRRYSYYNRAMTGVRQPGSSFKPFVYTAALDNGWRACDVITDSYYKFRNWDGSYWEPGNFENDFLNRPMTLRDGFKTSRNIIAIKLMNDTENRGIGPDMTIKYAKKMGITTNLEPNASLAIGTSPVKLIDLVSAYTVFPNHGLRTEHFMLDRVYDKNNLVLYRQPNGQGAQREALNPAVASLMITMLESVVKEGTASGTIRRMGMAERPAAGKTGTGNEYKDAWFIGFTPYLAAGVWVGFDSEETRLGGLYRTGASAALPAWVEFMTRASEELGLPKDPFKYSEDLTTARICRESYLRATPACPYDSTYVEFFVPGTEVTEFCPVHAPAEKPTDSRRFVPDRGRRRRGF